MLKKPQWNIPSHRPTWWRSSPVSQSLREECPRIGCIGGLAPGRQTLLTLPRILCKLWNPHRRPLADRKLVKIEYCKIYLFRPTSGFSSLWLPLLVWKHQRVRNYRECPQRNLPTNISSSWVVSKISKHKSNKWFWFIIFFASQWKPTSSTG